MCFDLDSRPPIPAIAGAAVDGQRIDLHASDGTRFLAFDARADSPTGAGVVILPDVRGLHHFYEELALRFAERGIDALTIDYFGRTAQTDDRGESFEFMPHVDQIGYETAMLDVKAAVDHLVGRGVRHVFTMGFCMGGRMAFLTGAREELGLVGRNRFLRQRRRRGPRRHAGADRTGTAGSSARRCWDCSAAPTRAFRRTRSQLLAKS